MKKLLFILFLLPLLSFSQRFQEEIELESLYSLPPSARIYNDIAKNLNYLNLLDSSQNASKKAIYLARQANDSEELGRGHLNSAIIYQKKGRYFEATDCYETAIKLSKNDSIVAFAYHLLGTCYKDQNLLEKGIECINKALGIAQKKNLKSLWALCLNSQGLTIFRKHDYYDKALVKFHEALNVANQTDDDYIKSAINKNIGWVHLLWEEEQKGLGYVQEAIRIQTQSDKSQVRQGLFYSYMVLIHFYHLVKKDYLLSNQYCEKAIKIAQKNSWIEEQSGVYHYLYLNHKMLNKPEKALEYHEKYQKIIEQLNEDKMLTQEAIFEERSINDGLTSENQRQETQRNWLIFSLFIVIIGSLIIYRLYRLNRKQKIRIEEINQNLELKVSERTAELQKAYDEIKDAMMRGQTLERKRVAADLHDNLGSLISALSMSMEAVDESNLSEKEQKIFKNIRNQLNIAHQEVRMFSHNLQPTELEKEGLYNALEILAVKINSLNKIHLELDLEQLIPQPQNIEFNLYSICMEAINNILKHSKATKAKIGFEKIDKQTIMRITDNGIGIKEELKDGFGLRNIQSRVEQIGGDFKLFSDDTGTTLEVRLS
ncbi:MAG: tetratricopeptide repeat protein [Spirosomataceae bacterium]